MGTSPSISVIIPTFNRAELIREALDSVLNQDIRGYDTEVIVVDDASTDGTREVVATFAQRHDVRYISQPHGGAGAARNRGIAQARGRWIAFLDSDDRWLPHHLSLHMAVIERLPDCKILFSDFSIFDDKGVWNERGLAVWERMVTGSTTRTWRAFASETIDSRAIGVTHRGKPFSILRGPIFGQLAHQLWIPSWTMMVRTDCIRDGIRFAEDLPILEDVWFQALLAQHDEFYFMDVITAENRGHAGPRVTQADGATRTACHIAILEKIYLPSHSPWRPPTPDLVAIYVDLQQRLFKEYLKGGRAIEAAGVHNVLHRMNIGTVRIPLVPYQIASVLPGNLMHRLVRLKRLLTRT
jgi:hypothetical protein